MELFDATFKQEIKKLKMVLVFVQRQPWKKQTPGEVRMDVRSQIGHAEFVFAMRSSCSECEVSAHELKCYSSISSALWPFYDMLANGKRNQIQSMHIH